MGSAVDSMFLYHGVWGALVPRISIQFLFNFIASVPHEKQFGKKEVPSGVSYLMHRTQWTNPGDCKNIKPPHEARSCGATSHTDLSSIS